MKYIWMLLVAIALLSCKDTPSQPPLAMSQIVANVHWQSQGIVGSKIELVQTGETKLTDSAGNAKFSVPAGIYIVRAYGIGTPGPGRPFVDFTVKALSGKIATVDIVDCFPCR